MPRQKFTPWIGRTDNTAAPENVQLRIVQRHAGCCAECGARLAIGRWHLDHKIPLQDGGVNAESNLQPLCVPCHGLKTALEATDRAKIRSKAKSHLGIKGEYRKRHLQSRGFVKKPKREIEQLPLPSRRIVWRVGELMKPIGSIESEGD